MNDLLIKLLISFGSIVGLGLITFFIIFFIHKSAFNKLKKQIIKFNEIKGKVYSINFYRINVLAQNEMLNKAKFESLRSNYEMLKTNCGIIFTNITKHDDVVRKMNIKEAKRIRNIIDADLNKTNRELDIFIKEFNKNTQYSDEIEDSLQISIDLFNAIKAFFYKKIVHHEKFNQINHLIDLIETIINNNIDFSSIFDFDATVKIFSDLHIKIKTLLKAVIAVTELQFVDIYLQTTKQNNEKLLNQNKKPLYYKDIEFIQKANRTFNLNYSMFKKAFISFDLNKAHKYVIESCKNITPITKFCVLNVSSQTLIENSLKLINNQTRNIIDNKASIINSISCLSQYFVKDKKTESYFKQLASDVNEVEKLSHQANNLLFHSTADKVKALKQIQNISTNITICKDHITDNVKNINLTLENIINLLTHLNELYTYHIQMLPTIKMLSNNDPIRDDFVALLNNNISLIQKCVNEIITSDDPNFEEIGSKIVNIVEETQQIKNKINTTVILKSYAKKLLLYANRFKKELNIDLFDKAEQEYKRKDYTKCLDTLLAICKKFK